MLRGFFFVDTVYIGHCYKILRAILFSFRIVSVRFGIVLPIIQWYRLLV